MKNNSIPYKARKQHGFTLIEIVIGIVILAISLVIVSSIFLPQANKTATPMYQIKATALGQRIMDQVLIRYYDEASTNSGGFIRCGETGPNAVPCSTVLGTDGSEKASAPDGFNDVDDYNVYCDTQANNDPGAVLGFFTKHYPGYGLRICVSFAADKFNVSLASSMKSVAKKIQVTIFMPNNETINLTAFKGNY